MDVCMILVKGFGYRFMYRVVIVSMFSMKNLWQFRFFNLVMCLWVILLKIMCLIIYSEYVVLKISVVVVSRLIQKLNLIEFRIIMNLLMKFEVVGRLQLVIVKNIDSVVNFGIVFIILL